ncbi:MAG: outer membrane lipoprotein carrier protein LolA [Rhodobacterales bacterium]|nr:outer membrane lipoprotein carrier protein LolA [Rhodobacterales bacterium]
MTMLRLFAAALWGLMLVLPARAAPIPLDDLSRYLNGLTTAEATFTQVNADGTLSTGRLFIHRPGRVRFEYDPPEAALVLAGGGQVAIFDSRSNQPPEQYPLARTPLGLILADRVDLARARMVVAHREDGPTTRVVAQDPDHPEYGRIELVFSPAPVALRQWIITDEAGGQTTVILDGLQTGVALGSSLFSISAEAQRRGIE